MSFCVIFSLNSTIFYFLKSKIKSVCVCLFLFFVVCVFVFVIVMKKVDRCIGVFIEEAFSNQFLPRVFIGRGPNTLLTYRLTMCSGPFR